MERIIRMVRRAARKCSYPAQAEFFSATIFAGLSRRANEAFKNMSSKKEKLRLTIALGVLGISALGISCRGFFQNPTLTSLSVGPATPSIETGSTNNTVQMTVFGTNNDGSTTSNPSVSWSISPTSTATITTTGLVKSVSTGSATVTATANQNPSITGSQTVTVTVGCITSITITGSPTQISVSSQPNTTTFTANANTCNGVFNITDVATWNTSNSQVATVNSGVVTAVAVGSVNINAQSGNIFSNNITVTVGP